MPQADAWLHVPSTELGAHIAAGVERDTRGYMLDARERFNFYPATPMAVISWCFQGELHLVDDSSNLSSPSPTLGPVLPRLSFSGPQRQPTASWSPGPVHALMVGIYPEAMTRLLGQPVANWINRTVAFADVAPPSLLKACEAVLADHEQPFARLESEWRRLGMSSGQSSTIPLLGNWLRTLTTQVTHSTAGCSLRQWQRRIRDWTGQSQRDLQLFVRMEEAFVRRINAKKALNLADIAADAGFSDQSHMGREIKRMTGIPPGKFGERLEKDESFWYYRLIAQEIAKQGDDL